MKEHFHVTWQYVLIVLGVACAVGLVMALIMFGGADMGH